MPDTALHDTVDSINATVIEMKAIMEISLVPLVRKHEKQISGNGDEGLKIKLDRLEQDGKNKEKSKEKSDRRRYRVLLLVVAPVYGLMIKEFWPIFFGG